MNAEELAKLSCDVNSWAWPECLGRKPVFHLLPYWSRWWSPLGWLRRLAYAFLRRHIDRELDHAFRSGVMRTVELAIGEKEVLRYWNTRHRTHQPMTDEEFERWWVDRDSWHVSLVSGGILTPNEARSELPPPPEPPPAIDILPHAL